MTTNSVQITVFRCEMCGAALVSGRKDRKTCSDTCRKRLSYHRKRIPAKQMQAINAVAELLEYMKSPETECLAQRAIADILKHVKYAAIRARVQEVR